MREKQNIYTCGNCNFGECQIYTLPHNNRKITSCPFGGDANFIKTPNIDEQLQLRNQNEVENVVATKIHLVK